MAITIAVEPQDWQSAYNEVVTILTSTKYTEPKFNYIVQIYVDGVYSSKLKVAPNPSGFGVVNLSKHIEPYLSSDINLSDSNIFKQIPNSYTKYSVVLKEEYVKTMGFLAVTDDGGFAEYDTTAYGAHPFVVGDIVTVTITVGGGTYDGEQEITAVNSTTSFTTTEVFTATEVGEAVLSSGATSITDDAAVFSGDKFALNNVVDWIDYNTFDNTDYEVETVTPALFLTNLESSQSVLLDDNINFNIYNKNTDDAYYLEVISTLGTIRIENSFRTTSDASKFLSIGVAPTDILNHSGSVITTVSGSSTVIDSTIDSYTVQLLDGAFAATSELFTFKVKSECKPYENYKLIYLNRAGSFSDFNFELGSSKKVDVKRKNYSKNYGDVTVLDATPQSYGWATSDRGTSVYASLELETYSITSDYLKEAEGNKIWDLIRSPEVYHLTDVGVLRAINIIDSSKSLKTRLQDKLINYNISFNYATKNSTQR